VAVLSNGDIVSGASDALVRIWTKNPARLASDEQREKLERDLRTRALNKTQVGDVNTTDLPGREALKRPGKHCTIYAHVETLDRTTHHCRREGRPGDHG